MEIPEELKNIEMPEEMRAFIEKGQKAGGLAFLSVDDIEPEDEEPEQTGKGA